MPNVLFVCMANQFRSPLAAALFEKNLKDENASAGWMVSSAGTWVEQESGAHPAAIHAAKNLGLDLSGHKSREVSADMIAAADL